MKNRSKISWNTSLATKLPEGFESILQGIPSGSKVSRTQYLIELLLFFSLSIYLMYEYFHMLLAFFCYQLVI
jgi:hypothetical protein